MLSVVFKSLNVLGSHIPHSPATWKLSWNFKLPWQNENSDVLERTPLLCARGI